MADGEEKQRFQRGEIVKNELPPQWKPVAGNEICGFYRGWKKIKPASAKEEFKIQVLEFDEPTVGVLVRDPVAARENPEAPGVAEDFDEGETVSLSGKILDRMMGRVPPNTFVWIKYNGKKKVGQGKAHDYTVQLPKGVQALPEAMEVDNTPTA